MKLTTEYLPESLAESSMAMYARDIAGYNHWCRGQEVDPASAEALALWRAYMVEQTDKKHNTIQRMLCAIRTCVRSMAEAGVIRPEVAGEVVMVGGVPKQAMQGRLGRYEHGQFVLTTEEIQDLANSPDLMTSIGLRDYAILLTLASSGIRVSEIVNLKDSDIERRGDGYAVRVCGKGGSVARWAPIAQAAKEAIDDWQEEKEWLGVECPYLFTPWDGRGTRPAARKMATASIWKIIKKYGSDFYPDLTTHDLRRYVGVEISRQHGLLPASEHLGHRDPRSTARYPQTGQLHFSQANDLV